MRIDQDKHAKRLDINEFLIVVVVLLLLWAGRASALDYEGINALLGRSKVLELAPEKLRHKLPVQVENALGYFIVDQGANELVMTREFVANNALWDYHFVREVPGGDLVEYKSVSVGKWILNDVRAVICDDCHMLAGRSILKEFNLGNIERGGVEYLTLTR